MKAIRYCGLTVILAVLVSACAGQNAQSGAAGGAAIGALLGYGIGALVDPSAALPAAAIGAAVGAGGGWAVGSQQDRQEINAYQQQQQAAAATAQMPREQCSWVYDSLGKAFWSCSGQQQRYRADGPPAMPFLLPPNVPQATYQQQSPPMRSPSFRSDSYWGGPQQENPFHPPLQIPVVYK